MRTIIKRDGREEIFNIKKVVNAINNAKIRTEENVNVNEVVECISFDNIEVVEALQNKIEKALMEKKYYETAREYITYRNKRNDERMKNTELYKIGQDIIDVRDLDLLHENANLNGESYSGKQSKMGSEYAKWYAKNYILPKNIAKAMDENYIHVHDLDHYAVGNHNCTFIPFGKILNNGFSTGNGSVRKPNSIWTAMQLVAIIFQSQQNCQYGGVAGNMIDWDLAPYVTISFKKHFRKGLKYLNETNDIVDDKNVFISNPILKDKYPNTYKFAYDETVHETYQASESLIHNLNTMNSRAGDQVPFTSLNYGTCTSIEGRLIIESLLKATIKGLGHGETPVFPIQIFKCKKEINLDENSPNHDLFKLAIECSSKRLYPNFVNIDAPYNLQYYVEGNPDTEIATMGCRTRVIADRFGYNHLSGKGNLSFNTINLVKLGIENGICLNKREVADENKLYNDLTNMIDIAIEGLLHRYNRQRKQKAKSSDFMMREGVWEGGENLSQDDEIGDLLKHGSLSIGFIGLAECMKAMYGKHHAEDEAVRKKAYKLIKFMREYCDKKSEEYDLNFSLFATPAEGLSGKFTRKDKQKYGEIEGITNKEYYTNSFHVPVYYPTTAFEKIKIEAPYHELCNAGAIGYIELDGNARNNIKAFEKIVRYALESNMTYFSINHPVDRCPSCGYEGIIGNQCPNCGVSEEEVRFSRLRRITGYLVGTLDKWNSSKKAEERDRIKHGVKLG